MLRSALLGVLVAVCLLLWDGVARAQLTGPGAQNGPALVIIVRHADRAARPAEDPPLSEAGRARARELAKILEPMGVTAIVTTQFRRTGETAQPTASARSISPIVVPVGNSLEGHIAALAAEVRKRAPQDIVLVVGHSNTVPALIGALGGPKLSDLCETSYGHLFLLKRQGAHPQFEHTHYGAADPPAGPNCL